MNTLTLNDLAPGTLVVDNNGKLAVVIDQKLNFPSNPVIYRHAPGGTTYRGPVSFFNTVLGKIDLQAFLKVPNPKEVPGPLAAIFGAPPELKGVKVGDKIRIRVPGGKTDVVTFRGYNQNRPKFPVSFEDSKGRLMKGTVSVVIGPVLDGLKVGEV